jgi:hypothetical protein
LRREELRARLAAGWAVVRRRPDAVIAAGLVAGVVLMILHWS